nr:unnamed protein product [Digitaria exilis]
MLFRNTHDSRLARSAPPAPVRLAIHATMRHHRHPSPPLRGRHPSPRSPEERTPVPSSAADLASSPTSACLAPGRLAPCVPELERKSPLSGPVAHWRSSDLTCPCPSFELAGVHAPSSFVPPAPSSAKAARCRCLSCSRATSVGQGSQNRTEGPNRRPAEPAGVERDCEPWRRLPVSNAIRAKRNASCRCDSIHSGFSRKRVAERSVLPQAPKRQARRCVIVPILSSAPRARLGSTTGMLSVFDGWIGNQIG